MGNPRLFLISLSLLSSLTFFLKPETPNKVDLCEGMRDDFTHLRAREVRTQGRVWSAVLSDSVMCVLA